MKRGMLFIYNAYFYKPNYGNRTNSEKDVEALTKTFKGMNAEVEDLSDDTIDHIRQTNPVRVRNDKLSDLDRLEQKIEKRITNRDFRDFDYVAFAILSHGSGDDKIELYDGSCNLEKTFLEPLKKNNSLRNKLKWIISTSCRGEIVISDNFSGAKNFENSRFFIVSFATTEGNISLRLKAGSVFIQTLCSVLERDKCEKDLKTILEDVGTIVNEKILLELKPVTQTTSIRHNLMPHLKFYFFDTQQLFIKDSK